MPPSVRGLHTVLAAMLCAYSTDTPRLETFRGSTRGWGGVVPPNQPPVVQTVPDYIAIVNGLHIFAARAADAACVSDPNCEWQPAPLARGSEFLEHASLSLAQELRRARAHSHGISGHQPLGQLHGHLPGKPSGAGVTRAPLSFRQEA